MPTTMHRLQVSLPEWQAQYLAERARLDGVSIAAVVRRLVEREARASSNQVSPDSLWEIAGMAEDHGPLVEGVPVSESPELYLTGMAPSEGEDGSESPGDAK